MPKRATTGSRTTVIAPVGPETWRFDPPKTAATVPATTAVARPACAPRPDATPKASASGSATIATVMPATRSRPGERRASVQSERRGSSAAIRARRPVAAIRRAQRREAR